MSTSKKSQRLLSAEEISVFCSQNAMILKSGISASEGVSIMLEDTASEKGKAILQIIHDRLELGEPLSKALSASGRFPEYVINMVTIGEQTGHLEQVMFELGEYYERENSISTNIKNAVMYPLIMIIMMVLVIGVLLVKVLPVFQQVFTELGGEMTGFSKAAMDFGSLISGISIYILAAVVAIVVLFFILRLTPQGGRLLEALRKRLLGGKKLQTKIASGRFASSMSMMLSSGLDNEQSLALAEKIIEDKNAKEKIGVCRKALAEGCSFSDALMQSKLFSGVYARMISVADKTGSSDAVMAKIAARYEEEVDNQISHSISIIEPTLVAVLSIVVGMILLSVMLPLMGIMSSIG